MICFIFLLIIVSACAETTNNQRCSQDVKFVRVAYYEDWLFYRQNHLKYSPDNIPLNPPLPTHVIYTFAVIDQSNFETIKPYDTSLALDQKFYQKITNLKKSGITPLLAMGGWNDSEKYWRNMLNNDEKQKKFVKNVTDFMLHHHFEGLDVDLLYPCKWKGEAEKRCEYDKKNKCTKDCDCDKDRVNYTKLLARFRNEFDKRRKMNEDQLILTAGVSAGKETIELAYEVELIASIVNWLHVLTYDFHVSSESKLGLGAPFEAQKGDDDPNLNVKAALNVWLSYGVPASKIVVAMPFYGPAFKLQSNTKSNINDPAGVRTKDDPSTYNFNEIVDLICKGGWKVVPSKIGTYASNGVYWVSYDDREDIARKSNYIVNNNFRGAAVWAIDKDTFDGVGCDKYALMTIVYNTLTGKNQDNVKNCTPKIAANGC